MLRTKSSALFVIIGPLLVVLLVGLAFNTKSLYELNVGMTGGVHTSIGEKIYSSLTNKSYLVLRLDSQQECIDMIKQGAIHTCIVIPNNFSVTTNNTIYFYVDNSRPNLVWKVIGAVSQETNLRAEELSYQLSSDLLRVINDIKASAQQGIAKVIDSKTHIDQAINLLNQAKTSNSKVRLSNVSIDISTALSDLSSINSSASSTVSTISKKVKNILSDVNATNTSKSNAKAINSSIHSYYSDLSSKINTVRNDLNSLNSQVEKINSNISSVNQNSVEVAQKIDSTIAKLNSIKNELDDIKAVYEGMIDEINNIKVASAEKISHPLQTKIETVATKDSQILYMSPYLLMLLIMLVGLMLSGTLVVVEKKSKAMFRNYTVPTTNLKFVLSYYLTSLLLVFIEVVIISGIAYLFIDGALLSNIDRLLVLVVLSITLFNLLGIILGYLSDGQEGLTIGALSLGIILLFISNLVLPLESMTPMIRHIAEYNPYVIASETARKIMLFNEPWRNIYHSLLLLLLYIFVAIVLIFIAEKLSFKRIVTKGYKHMLRLAVHGVILGNKTIMTKKDLIDFLKSVKDDEWNKYRKNKELREFIKKVLKDKKALKHMSSRKELLEYLSREPQEKE